MLSTRSVTLEPEFASARAARRLLRDALVEADREMWCPAGQLAISEVVANAVLHARTSIRVSIELRPEVLDVEVRDFSATRPVVPGYDDESTTGRDMALVAAVTSECGVRSTPAAGKSVWFRVRSGPGEAPWRITWRRGTSARRTCRMLRTTSSLCSSRPSHPGCGSPRGNTTTPCCASSSCTSPTTTRSNSTCRESRQRSLAGVPCARQGVEETWRWGTAPGHRPGTRQRPAVTARQPGPRAVGPSRPGTSFVALQDALDLAERLALAGRLLVRPGLPELVELRDWVCDQVVAQVPVCHQHRGQAQRSSASRPRSGKSRAPEGPSWDVSLVRDSAQGAVAGDDGNRIIAVSASLAVALELPVLAKDGSAVRCRFRLERAPSGPGRTVYIAWIDPLE